MISSKCLKECGYEGAGEVNGRKGKGNPELLFLLLFLFPGRPIALSQFS